MPKDHSNSDTYASANNGEALSRTTMLRHLVCGPEIGFLMEAHNALSAKIAENAGFKALWASSLTVSATMGLRDANELTWSESLDIVSAMVDKLFPKINSFADTDQQLTSVQDFCSKIRAAKDNQTHSDFVVIARTEGFVVGANLQETLARAEAYHEAGADAVLVHSKHHNADEVLSFADKWQKRAPLIVVPTTYANTPTQSLAEAGVSAIIWANHSLRAAIRAMENLTRHIYDQQSLSGVDEAVASIDDVFALTGMDELIADTKRHQGNS